MVEAYVWDSLTKQNLERSTFIKHKDYKIQTYATKGHDLSFQWEIILIIILVVRCRRTGSRFGQDGLSSNTDSATYWSINLKNLFCLLEPQFPHLHMGSTIPTLCLKVRKTPIQIPASTVGLHWKAVISLTRKQVSYMLNDCNAPLNLSSQESEWEFSAVNSNMYSSLIHSYHN